MKQRIIALSLVTLLSACSGTIEAPDHNPTPSDNKEGPGLFSGESGNMLDAFRRGGSDGETTGGGAGIGVNGYLWRSALDAISFMPVTQADSAGGVIITDWYTNPQKPDERVKANIYILSKKIDAQGVRVSLFKQAKVGNAWEDVAISPETQAQLEETILTNARVLRVKEKASK